MFDHKAEYDFVVFSATSWENTSSSFRSILFQFSKTHKILVVEEPETSSESFGTVSTFTPFPNIIVAKPHVGSIQDNEVLANILHGVISKHLDRPAIVWSRNPSYFDVFSKFSTKAVVYDMIDGAVFNESMLAHASMVVTDKTSLESESHILNNSFKIVNPSQFEPFKMALLADTRIPADMRTIPTPIVGYYGPLDETLDIDLIDTVAKESPEISFVFVQSNNNPHPIVLPHNKNIYNLGYKSFNLIPNYIKAFEIAYIPFLETDEAKERIKTNIYQYLAAKKVVVSSDLGVIDSSFDEAVVTGFRDKGFSVVLKNLISEPTKMRAQRLRKAHQIIRNLSWDKIALQVDEQIKTYIESQGMKTDSDTRIVPRTTNYMMPL